MSDYTIELRRISELYGENEVKSWFKQYDLNDYLTNEQIADIAGKGTWSKDKLAEKIYNYYYMREIGFETPALFKHFVKVKMNEIMEAKLPIIWSATIDYDPLVNVDYQESFEKHSEGADTDNSTTGNNESINETRGTTGASVSSATSSSSGLNVNSDTPQGQISKSAILGGSYASSTSASEAESTTSSNTQDNTNMQDTIQRANTGTLARMGTNNKDEAYTKKVKGNTGVMATYQKLIQQYRDIIVAVDKEIIEEMNPLFIGLF